MSEVTATEDDALDLASLNLGIRQTLAHLQRVGVCNLPTPDGAVVTRLVGEWNQPTDEMASAPSSKSQHSRASDDRPAEPTEPKLADELAAAGPRTKASNPPPSTLLEPGAQQYTTAALPVADRSSSLDHWRQQVAECTKCQELACTRKQTVFGEGSTTARVCFFGEAPGADEDREGRPFVGRAGQLLTKIIEACQLKREETYILNTLKCRPPGNRNPLPEELANCRPFFETQLEVIQPEYIVCLGLFAAQSLLDTKLSIGRMRGRFHRYLGSKVVVTYHPAYLLRNEKMKGAAWQDMQMMMRDMGTLS